jgi:hypothetical protein
MGFSLRLQLLVFIWSVMNCKSIPLPHEIMQRNTWLSFRNKLTSRYEVRTNNICHLIKAKFCAKYGSMDMFYNLSQYVPLLPTFCSTQGYPTKVSGSHSYTCTSHWISGKVPPWSHVDASLYMFLILQLRHPFCVISPQHQPLIEPNTSKNTKLAVMYSLAQQKSNSNYQSLQVPHSIQSTTNSTKTTELCSFALELPFLYSSYNVLLPLSIECLQCPSPPIICCQLISHNTQTNKVSYPNSQVFSK